MKMRRYFFKTAGKLRVWNLRKKMERQQKSYLPFWYGEWIEGDKVRDVNETVLKCVNFISEKEVFFMFNGWITGKAR